AAPPPAFSARAAAIISATLSRAPAGLAAGFGAAGFAAGASLAVGSAGAAACSGASAGCGASAPAEPPSDLRAAAKISATDIFFFSAMPNTLRRDQIDSYQRIVARGNGRRIRGPRTGTTEREMPLKSALGLGL